MLQKNISSDFSVQATAGRGGRYFVPPGITKNGQIIKFCPQSMSNKLFFLFYAHSVLPLPPLAYSCLPLLLRPNFCCVVKSVLCLFFLPKCLFFQCFCPCFLFLVRVELFYTVFYFRLVT